MSGFVCLRTCLVVAVLLIGAAADLRAATPRDATPAPDASAPRGRLLDVPFLPQREDLCGGAAAAMVLRYWGATAFADDFADLVEPRAEGIRTTVLVRAIAARGWQAVAAAPTAPDGAAWVGGHLAAGRPVIALIAVGGGRFHYVVIVAQTSERVVLHDPAVGPFRVLTPQAFDAAWAAAGRWALLVVPEIAATAPPVAQAGTSLSSSAPPSADRTRASVRACDPIVDAMVEQARAGALDAAALGLESATRQCPESPAAWRELAGVRFLQSRWRDAADHAGRATMLAPGEASGWDLLATSQFLDGRPLAALTSWNQVGRPVVAGIDVNGPRRTRPPVVVERLGVEAHATLTADAFTRASRRLADLPSASTTSLRFEPLPDGRVALHATVLERPLAPSGAGGLAMTAVHGAIHRELRAALVSPTGSGEVWTAGWRWWRARPRVTFAVDAPAPGSLPGLVIIDALWERASYDVGPAGRVRQTRRRSALHVADWATGAVRWRLGAAIDRWDDRGFAAVDGGLTVRSAGDHLVLGADAGVWRPLSRGNGFVRAGVTLAAQSAVVPEPAAWRVAAGLTRIGTSAPLDVWEGAGLGLARAPLLRAHSLLNGGVVTGQVFGRTLAHASVEHERRLVARVGGVLGVAAFVDLAHASRRAWPDDAWQADAGLGLRVHLPGGAGALRLDVARGLRDRRHALSAGWVVAGGS